MKYATILIIGILISLPVFAQDYDPSSQSYYQAREQQEDLEAQDQQDWINQYTIRTGLTIT